MTAQEIIQKRKELWEQHKDIEKDREFVEAVAEYIVSDKGKEVRETIHKEPRLLIEMVFVIADKNQNTVPFFLNDVQRDFSDDLYLAIEEFRQGKRLNLKFLVLKGRQQGFTSYITAEQLARAITKRNFSGFTIADCTDNTHTIFEDKAKFPYNHLPEQLKPTEKYNNRKELHFEKLNSRWRIATATKDIGRSKTVNFLHGSEAGFWEVPISDIQAAIGEALTRDAIQILESTANGHNEFKDAWDSGKWQNLFYEWWRTPEYRLNFESVDKEQQFKQDVQTKPGWIYKRCKWLIETIGLDWNQVYWYFNKWDNYIDKEKIKQEYPCSPDEAFLASGRCVFDVEKIIQRKEYLRRLYAKQEPTRGFFSFEWKNPETRDRIKDSTIKFQKDQNGFIVIYEPVEPGVPYVIGGDTAGEGSDYFTGQVLDNVTGAQVAALRHQFDEDLYTKQIYCLGKYYNTALLGIETNYSTFPVKELHRLGYPKQYIREKIDTYTGKTQETFGFRTDKLSRPLIIANLVQIVREHPELINDIPTLEEMLTFVRNEKGKPEAQEGKHDDLIMALAIAYHIRTQQTFEIETKPEPKKQLPFALQIEEPEGGWLEW